MKFKSIDILFRSITTSVTCRANNVVALAKFYTSPGGNIRKLTILC